MPKLALVPTATPRPEETALLSAIALPAWIYETGTGRVLALNEAASLQYGRLKLHKDALHADILSERDIRFAGVESRLVIASGADARRANYDEIASREERFRALIDGSAEIIYEADAKGFFTFISAAVREQLGFDPSELVGRHYSTLIREDWRERTVQHYRNARGTASSTYYEFPAIAADGRVVWVGQSVQPVIEGSSVIGFRAVARDITDRIELESELAAARDAALASARQKSQFLANMSHEIRTPMNGVIGLLGILADTELSADQRDLASTARSSAESLLTIINDILDFSKIEAGKLTFEEVDFDVRAACEATIDLLADSARRKQIEIGYVIDPDIPRALRGDSGRLRQVLLNLIGNAIKFTASGGVLVQVENAEDNADSILLRFRITDTGLGMSESTQQQLFQPFSQGDESTTRRFGGTGLGLAISKELVGMMGGQMGVDSEIGCGSTFWFTARFASPDENRPRVMPKSQTLPRVLVVDDSTTTRQMIALQLTAWGVSNETADDSFTAMAMLRDATAAGSPFDVVVTDMQMPRIDGVALARLVKGDKAFGAPQFVLISSKGVSLDAAQLTQLGITKCLTKPVKPQHLFNAICGRAAAEAVIAVPVPAVVAITPHMAARRRVLVVDDNVVNQKVALRQLQKLGVAADAVGNGLEALESMRRIAYDVVLMDCQMPEMDGYEATAELRRRESVTGKRTAVIALTASASDSDRDRCLDAGMDDFVTKPVREAQLASALERWLPV